MSAGRDVAVGAFGVTLAALYWWGAQAIPSSPLDGGVGAAGLPNALALALGGLAALLALRGLAGAFVASRAATSSTAPAEQQGATPPGAKGWRAHGRALVMLAIGIAYVAALEWLGYALAVLVLFATVAAFNGARPGWRFAAVSLGMALLFHVLFVRFLGIPLPAGLWPGLFDT